MKYQEIKPGNRLAQYIKCYYLYESTCDIPFEDTVFPSGCMEIIFNLGTGKWQTATGDNYTTTPPVELWGQIIKPLAIRSIGKNIMLGVRFFPHAAGCFFNESIEQFNNQVIDFNYLAGNRAKTLHDKLLETNSRDKRIVLLEDFLWIALSSSERKKSRISMVNSIMHELKGEDFFDNIENIASRYGITSRYLQKIFLQYTGLTPKLYSKINRFQNSLTLVTKRDISLTAIAYDCGYFDQSHFIREFKSFTGLTPSGYTAQNSPITFAFSGN